MSEFYNTEIAKAVIQSFSDEKLRELLDDPRTTPTLLDMVYLEVVERMYRRN